MSLQEYYKKEILPKLKEKFSIKNNLAVPRLEKVTMNVGFGRQSKDKERAELIGKNLTDIAGQKCVFTLSKKAISAFKIKEGLVIGATVNLRGKRMYDFVERLVNIYFPRVRDFRGISEKSVDRSGNLTVGFKDVMSFPEIELKNMEDVHGLEISISTTAQKREEGLGLLKLINFPFKKEE